MPSDDPSLIARYAASGKTTAPIPLPTTVSLFQLIQSSDRSDPTHSLTFPAIQACMLLRKTLRERHETITLIASPRTIRAAVVEFALSSLNFERICNVQIGSWESFANELSSRINEAQDVEPRQFVLVVDDAHLLPFIALQALIRVSEEPERFSIQVLLAGQCELGVGLSPAHRTALAGRLRANIVLSTDVVTVSKSRIEDDLVRGWRSAEAERDPEAPPFQTESSHSPFPALAALLGQSAPRRPPRARWVYAVVVAAVVVLCLFGGLIASQHRV